MQTLNGGRKAGQTEKIQEQTVRMGDKQGKAKKIIKLIISWLLFIGYLIVLSYFLFSANITGARRFLRSTVII